MSLEGARFICLDEAGNHGNIVMAKGRKFSVGYYTSCDLPIADERAKGIHCTIECDAFGRITIRNFCSENPIAINDEVVENQRVLFHKTTIKILDKLYLWEFAPKNVKEFEDVPSGEVSTPQKQIGIPQQSAFSCPDVKHTGKTEPRFTIHNFAYCIQSDEEGNTSVEDSHEVSIEEVTDPSTKAEGKECIDDDTVQSLPIATAEGDGGGGGGGREVTPEPEDRKPSTEAQETPKMNLINCTNNKENSSSTQKKNNLQLSMCHQSDVVITSFSPRETGVRTEKSFTAILKPKVLVTRAPNTPKSVYSTPKSVLGDDEDEVDKSRDFHTPSTSRKAIKNQKNTSMHLVDYTTPNKLATPASPYLKSALKASAKKHHLTPTVKSCKEKGNTADTALGLSHIPITPVLSDDCKTRMETPSSVISVNSTDSSSVIEILSDESTPGTNANVLLKTPSKTDATKQTVTTPMRTPQSLMKRAILTSTKKQITTPQRSEAAQATPRREPINRIPLRTSIGSLRSPVTPKTGGTEAQISRRLSMSTPSRKSMSSVMTKKLENTPSSTTKASITTTTPSTSRRSSLIPMSASRAQTSTPLNYSNRRHSTCKTSPLNKVRKSVGGVPLSSHISKARRSIITSSPAQYTSIKQKSPQQMMSDRLVTRARKSLGVTPILSRAINMVQSAKASKGGAGTTPSSILKRQTGRKSMAATTSARSVLFADKSKKPIEEAPADLGRSLTFVLDSDDGAKKEIKKKEIDTFDLDKETQDNKEMEKTLNVTFSPDKEKVADAETRSLDIPIDVEELIEKDKCQDNDEILRGKVELQEGNDTVPLEQIEERDSPEEESSASGNGTTADENKTCATEECFAEVISDSQEENQIEKEIDEEKAEVVGNFTEETEKVSETSRNPEENETGFGEESSLIEKLHSADSNKSERVEETKSNEVEQLITDDVIELDSTAEGSDLEKSIRTESDTKDIPEKLCSVYKPICEDITLEGSVIEGSVIVSEKSIVEENPDNKTSNEKEPSSEGSVLKEEKVDGNEAKNSTITTEVLLEESVTEEQDTNQTEFERPTESLPEESKSEEDEQLQDSVLSADEPVLDKSVTVGEEEQHITEVSLDDSVTGVQDTNKNVIEERIETLSDDLKSEEQQTIKDKEPLADESILEKSVTVEEKIQNLSDKQDTNQTEFEGRTESLPEESKSEEQSADESILEKSVTVEEQVKSQTEAGISPTKEKQTADLLSEEQQIGVDNENSYEAEESEAKESDALNSSVEDRTKAPHVSKKHDAEQKKQSEEENTNESLLDVSLSQQLDNSQQEISISDNLSEEINKSQTEDNNSVVEEGTEADNSVTKQLDKNLASNDVPMEEPNSAVSLTDAEEDSSINVDESKQTKKYEGTPDLEESDNLKENISCASKDNEDPNESVSEHNISEVEKSPEQPERIVTSDLHSTSKLLEQIEDVLNKSDEMKQKHLEENKEDCESINTLTEENESIKLTQDSISDCPPIEEYCAIDATTVDDEDPKNVTTGGEDDVEDDIVTEKESFDVSKEETEKVDDIPVEKENNSEESVDNKPQKSSDVDNVGNDEISANKRISPTNINHKLIENQSNAGTPKRRSRRASMLIENTDEAKENIDMSLQNVAKKLLETECGETTATTPRRSLRRKSIANTTTTTDSSNDVDGGENKSDVRQLPTFTPRRSARRASMSIEMTNTNTPTSKKSRRASLSAVSEAPLTPKRITRRRSSISLDNDEVVKVIQESPTTSAAAPAQRDLPISEEINEDMGAIIEEEEEEDECVKSKKSTQGNNMNEDELNEETNKSIIEENVCEIVGENPSASLEAKKETEQATVTTDLNQETDNTTKGKEIKETAQEDQVPAQDSNTDENLFQEEQNEETISKDAPIQAEVFDSEDIVEAIPQEEDMQTLLVSDEDEVDEKSINVEETKVAETPLLKKSVKIVSDSPRSPVLTGMRELLKTPKSEQGTPIFKGIRHMVRTPKLKETEEEEADNSLNMQEMLKSPIAYQTSEVIDDEEKKDTKSKLQKTPKKCSTPHFKGMRELMKTPKTIATPLLGGLKELLDTPIAHETVRKNIDNTPTTSKHVEMGDSRSKGMNEMIRTPKGSCTPVFSAAKDLLETPKQEPISEAVQGNTTEETASEILNENEENDVKDVKESLQTSESSKELLDASKLEVATEEAENSTTEETVSKVLVKDEEKGLKGVKELLKTPKTCATPRFKGMRELMQTPKGSCTPVLGGVKELLDTPKLEAATEDPENNKADEIVNEVLVEDEEKNLKGVKELLKTPKICGTPRFKGLRELMQTPKGSSTPVLGGVKELLDTLKQESDTEETVSSTAEEIVHEALVQDEEKNLKGVKELLKTPKTCVTPRFKGMRELIQTPKGSSTPVLTGVKELLDTPKREASTEEADKSTTNEIVSEVLVEDEDKDLKGIKELLKTPKTSATPRFKGMRELMKTPKGSCTPALGGIKELLNTPEPSLEHEDVETITASCTEVDVLNINKKGVKELLSTPKSTATPRFKGMRELMQTPKVSSTPVLSGVKELLETPKKQLDIIENIGTTVTDKTPSESLNKSNDKEEEQDLKGVKELLKTPKTTGTPRFKGMRELMKTPKVEGTPIMGGVKELLDTSDQNKEDTDNNGEQEEIVEPENDDIPTTSLKGQSKKDLKGGKELLKTPKGCSTPRFRGMRELMQTPKMTSTPVLSGLKDLMETPKPTHGEDDGNNLDKFLKTPTAKNIMIPTLPSSAIIEKREDSVEMVHSTVYDLNDTNDGGSVHLEELFKTPVASRIAEENKDYDEDTEESENPDNDSATTRTPVRKVLPRKSLILNTPKFQSPFSAAEVLSDLSKTEVEEWVGKVDPLQQTMSLEEDDVDELKVTKTNLDDSIIEVNESLSEIPETCVKANQNDNNLANKSEAMINITTVKEGTASKDPLSNTASKLKASEKRPRTPIIDADADISGINLLDQTGESALDGSLLVSEDDEEEEDRVDIKVANRTLNDSNPQDDDEEEKNKTLCEDDGNELSESLVVSDSEELEMDKPENLTNSKLTSELSLNENPNEKDESAEKDLEDAVEGSGLTQASENEKLNEKPHTEETNEVEATNDSIKEEKLPCKTSKTLVKTSSVECEDIFLDDSIEDNSMPQTSNDSSEEPQAAEPDAKTKHHKPENDVIEITSDESSGDCKVVDSTVDNAVRDTKKESINLSSRECEDIFLDDSSVSEVSSSQKDPVIVESSSEDGGNDKKEDENPESQITSKEIVDSATEQQQSSADVINIDDSNSCENGAESTVDAEKLNVTYPDDKQTQDDIVEMSSQETAATADIISNSSQEISETSETLLEEEKQVLGESEKSKVIETAASKAETDDINRKKDIQKSEVEMEYKELEPAEVSKTEHIAENVLENVSKEISAAEDNVGNADVSEQMIADTKEEVTEGETDVSKDQTSINDMKKLKDLETTEEKTVEETINSTKVLEVEAVSENIVGNVSKEISTDVPEQMLAETEDDVGKEETDTEYSAASIGKKETDTENSETSIANIKTDEKEELQSPETSKEKSIEVVTIAEIENIETELTNVSEAESNLENVVKNVLEEISATGENVANEDISEQMNAEKIPNDDKQTCEKEELEVPEISQEKTIKVASTSEQETAAEISNEHKTTVSLPETEPTSTTETCQEIEETTSEISDKKPTTETDSENIQQDVTSSTEIQASVEESEIDVEPEPEKIDVNVESTKVNEPTATVSSPIKESVEAESTQNEGVSSETQTKHSNGNIPENISESRTGLFEEITPSEVVNKIESPTSDTKLAASIATEQKGECSSSTTETVLNDANTEISSSDEKKVEISSASEQSISASQAGDKIQSSEEEVLKSSEKVSQPPITDTVKTYDIEVIITDKPKTIEEPIGIDEHQDKTKKRATRTRKGSQSSACSTDSPSVLPKSRKTRKNSKTDEDVSKKEDNVLELATVAECEEKSKTEVQEKLDSPEETHQAVGVSKNDDIDEYTKVTNKRTRRKVSQDSAHEDELPATKTRRCVRRKGNQDDDVVPVTLDKLEEHKTPIATDSSETPEDQKQSAETLKLDDDVTETSKPVGKSKHINDSQESEMDAPQLEEKVEKSDESIKEDKHVEITGLPNTSESETDVIPEPESETESAPEKTGTIEPNSEKVLVEHIEISDCIPEKEAIKSMPSSDTKVPEPMKAEEKPSDSEKISKVSDEIVEGKGETAAKRVHRKPSVHFEDEIVAQERNTPLLNDGAGRLEKCEEKPEEENKLKDVQESSDDTKVLKKRNRRIASQGSQKDEDISSTRRKVGRSKRDQKLGDIIDENEKPVETVQSADVHTAIVDDNAGEIKEDTSAQCTEVTGKRYRRKPSQDTKPQKPHISSERVTDKESHIGKIESLTSETATIETSTLQGNTSEVLEAVKESEDKKDVKESEVSVDKDTEEKTKVDDMESATSVAVTLEHNASEAVKKSEDTQEVKESEVFEAAKESEQCRAKTNVATKRSRRKQSQDSSNVENTHSTQNVGRSKTDEGTDLSKIPEEVLTTTDTEAMETESISQEKELEVVKECEELHQDSEVDKKAQEHFTKRSRRKESQDSCVGDDNMSTRKVGRTKAGSKVDDDKQLDKIQEVPTNEIESMETAESDQGSTTEESENRSGESTKVIVDPELVKATNKEEKQHENSTPTKELLTEDSTSTKSPKETSIKDKQMSSVTIGQDSEVSEKQNKNEKQHEDVKTTKDNEEQQQVATKLTKEPVSKRGRKKVSQDSHHDDDSSSSRKTNRSKATSKVDDNTVSNEISEETLTKPITTVPEIVETTTESEEQKKEDIKVVEVSEVLEKIEESAEQHPAPKTVKRGRRKGGQDSKHSEDIVTMQKNIKTDDVKIVVSEEHVSSVISEKETPALDSTNESEQKPVEDPKTAKVLTTKRGRRKPSQDTTHRDEPIITLPEKIEENKTADLDAIREQLPAMETETKVTDVPKIPNNQDQPPQAVETEENTEEHHEVAVKSAKEPASNKRTHRKASQDCIAATTITKKCTRRRGVQIPEEKEKTEDSKPSEMLNTDELIDDNASLTKKEFEGSETTEEKKAPSEQSGDVKDGEHKGLSVESTEPKIPPVSKRSRRKDHNNVSIEDVKEENNKSEETHTTEATEKIKDTVNKRSPRKDNQKVTTTEDAKDDKKTLEKEDGGVEDEDRTELSTIKQKDEPHDDKANSSAGHTRRGGRRKGDVAASKKSDSDTTKPVAEMKENQDEEQKDSKLQDIADTVKETDHKSTNRHKHIDESTHQEEGPHVEPTKRGGRRIRGKNTHETAAESTSEIPHQTTKEDEEPTTVSEESGVNEKVTETKTGRGRRKQTHKDASHDLDNSSKSARRVRHVSTNEDEHTKNMSKTEEKVDIAVEDEQKSNEKEEEDEEKANKRIKRHQTVNDDEPPRRRAKHHHDDENPTEETTEKKENPTEKEEAESSAGGSAVAPDHKIEDQQEETITKKATRRRGGVQHHHNDEHHEEKTSTRTRRGHAEADIEHDMHHHNDEHHEEKTSTRTRRGHPTDVEHDVQEDKEHHAATEKATKATRGAGRGVRTRHHDEDHDHETKKAATSKKKANTKQSHDHEAYEEDHEETTKSVTSKKKGSAREAHDNEVPDNQETTKTTATKKTTGAKQIQAEEHEEDHQTNKECDDSHEDIAKTVDSQKKVSDKSAKVKDHDKHDLEEKTRTVTATRRKASAKSSKVDDHKSDDEHEQEAKAEANLEHGHAHEEATKKASDKPAKTEEHEDHDSEDTPKSVATRKKAGAKSDKHENHEEHDHEESTKSVATRKKASAKSTKTEDSEEHDHEETHKTGSSKRKAVAKQDHEIKAPVSRRRGALQRKHEGGHEDDVHDVVDSDAHVEKTSPVEGHSPEDVKKGRGTRRKKGDDHKESEEQHPATSNVTEVKPKSRKRKESHTEPVANITNQEDTISQTPQTPTRAQTSNEEHNQTPESEKRGRSVPQRRAAIVHHNYDESSDSEKPGKKKQKTEPPRKATDPTDAEKVLTDAVKSEESSSDQSPTLLASTTTARGRTRKPTARVQQFLEEERAKAETPKKRGGAAVAVATAATTETPTKRQPIKRGGKAVDTTETEAAPSNTETSKRVRGKHATEEPLEQSTSGTQESEHTTSTPATTDVPKGRKGYRKAKANVHSDPDEAAATEEPPAKKSPLVLEAEKKAASPEKSENHDTPARTTGRRNAAAAAKVRIEEEAMLAAATVEAPKKSRAKKSPLKVSTAVSSTSTGKRDHRLISASTVDGNEDHDSATEEDHQQQTTTAHKRGTRKAAIITSATDSPAVPAKRGRKAKATTEVETSDAVEEPKTSRSAASRGRKNVDPTPPVSSDSVEQHQADGKAVEEQQPAAATTKRATRVRRK